jgi:hypothetical protein
MRCQRGCSFVDAVTCRRAGLAVVLVLVNSQGRSWGSRPPSADRERETSGGSFGADSNGSPPGDEGVALRGGK